MNKLNICKGAFILAGMQPINNLEANTLEANIANNRYDSIIKRILSDNYWDFATKQVELNKSPEQGDYEFKNKFLLPSDFLRISGFLFTENIDKPAGYKMVGNKLYTNEDRVFLEYVALVEDSEIPHFLHIVIEYDLASEIVYSLTEDKTKSRELKGQAEYYLSRAKQIDMMNSPAKKMWNSSYLNARRNR